MNGVLVAIGLISGVFAGLFGIGGGVVIVAALITFAKFPVHKATGTSLAALLLPVGILGAWEYWKHGQVDFKAALILAAGLAVGAWFGARMADQISGPTLQRSFAVFLLLIAVRMWVKA